VFRLLAKHKHPPRHSRSTSTIKHPNSYPLNILASGTMVPQANVCSGAHLHAVDEARLNGIGAQINALHVDIDHSIMNPGFHDTAVKVDELKAAIEAMLAREKNLLQSHSIQLVKMQSQMVEMEGQMVKMKSQIDARQQVHVKDLEAQDQLVSEVRELQSAIAYLKGRVAAVTIDVYSETNKAYGKGKVGATQHVRLREPVAHAVAHPSFKCKDVFENTMSSAATLVGRCNAAGSSVEMVANQMLLEQKNKIIDGLTTLVACYEYLGLDSGMVNDVPNPNK
ncbi:hypothetical protein TOPH_05388, partial [Tolypocladium ophioglossoides CBS 100239]